MSAVRISTPRQAPPLRPHGGSAWRGIDLDGVPPAPWLTVYGDEDEDGTLDEPVLEACGSAQLHAPR